MFVVYITVYAGCKMPAYYIGSTSFDKYSKGYTGTVLSKAYKAIYAEEKELNPDLFDTILLETCNTRQEALIKELYWQKRVNAKTNLDYFNMSWASPKGFFGNGASGSAHPNYGGHNCKGYMHSYNPITYEPAFLDHIPDGNIKGRSPKYTNRSSHNKGKHWYNNGKIEILSFASDVPKGFKKGQLMTDAKKHRIEVRRANKLNGIKSI